MAKPPKISKRVASDAARDLGDPKSSKKLKEQAAEVMRNLPRKKGKS